MLYADIINIVQQLTHILARGGGGGSGGGGSGGGGSIIALIGYVPAHFAAQYGTKKFSPTVGMVLGAVLGAVVTIPIMRLSIGFGLLVGAGAAAGVYSGSHNVWSRIKKSITRSQQVMKVAASTDPVWQEAAVTQRIADTFMKFQSDWSNFNTNSIKTYTSPHYFAHINLMLFAMQQMRRRNNVQEPVITESGIAEAVDSPDNDNDKIAAFITAQARDELIDTETGEVLYTDKRPFNELWHFDRQGDEWVLEGVEQMTADAHEFVPPLQAFAQKYGMYYSLDWGWLLLPKRGQLFSRADFKRSDVNNHVIGQWQGLLVQLYTFLPLKSNANGQNYLIAQINVQKNYGGILIRRKSWNFLRRGPRGYQKMTFEWPDFNKRYEVYATDVDQVTSFELLNPAFMAELYDMNIKVDIEVVDTVIYLYAKVNSPALNYENMMLILQRAFRELKR